MPGIESATARPQCGIWALQGTIPAALAGLGKITQFVLNGNQLSGSIPSYLGSFPGLSEAWVARNKLSGPLSPNLCNGSFSETNIHLQVGSGSHLFVLGSQCLCLRSLSTLCVACVVRLCMSGGTCSATCLGHADILSRHCMPCACRMLAVDSL